MPRRQIVEIDETKRDGCRRGVPACAEGAIRMFNGKAHLMADTYRNPQRTNLMHDPTPTGAGLSGTVALRTPTRGLFLLRS